MTILQATGKGTGFVVISAEPHDLVGLAVHHMEEVTARRLHCHSEGDHWFRPTNQSVEISSGETGTLMQTVDDVAA
ncbi:hypothetical protein [Pseudomonas sp. FP818]|uniref:hypothetical protein n=1 Tax=Pseudomonas sp. FP818 TaxID=2954099 RepID=UPI00273495D3|nr:hypothetical protein [Pseudomonas sp. FP818]WLI32896.1 hypothetical protein PSH80_16720 [Pseudomonas sp. FP818]